MTKERQELVEKNMPLAHFVANRYRSVSVDFDDIRQTAYLGLVKAVIHFDSDKGIRFSSFAVTVITNEIRIFLRNQRKHEFVTASLDAELMTGEDCTLNDIIPDTHNDYERVDTVYDLQKNIQLLSETELKVLQLKISNPEATQMDLEEILGLSQSYISRILKQVRKKVLYS